MIKSVMPERIFTEDLFKDQKPKVKNEEEDCKYQIVEIANVDKHKLAIKYGLIAAYIILLVISLLLV